MKAMDRIRSLTKRSMAKVGASELARRAGVSDATVSRFWYSGACSPKIAKYMADTYGGKFQTLWDRYRLEAEARAEAKRQARQEFMRTPPASLFVTMAGKFTQEPETHNLPPIDQDDILATTLPVVHPQPINLGTPSWAMQPELRAAA